MATSKRIEKTTNSKDRKDSDMEQAQAQTEASLSQVIMEEEARKKAESDLVKVQEIVDATQKEVKKERERRKEIEEELAKTQEALNAAQADLDQEHQAREKARQVQQEKEKALSEAKKTIAKERRDQTIARKELDKVQETLTSTQADLDQERQAREKAEKLQIETEQALSEAKQLLGNEGVNKEHRTSFIVRVTVDEHGQPKRTEIVNAKSGEKKGYSTLNGDDLVAFMKAYLSLLNTSESSVPDEQVIPPGTTGVEASLLIDSVQLVRPSVHGGKSMILNPNEPFGIHTKFMLEGKDALSITTEEPGYEIEIAAYDVIHGKADPIAAQSGKLVKDQLNYSDFVGYSNLPSGLYRLVATITIESTPRSLSGQQRGPTFQITGTQPIVSSEVTVNEAMPL